MSHITKLQLKVDDAESLRKALKDLGYKILDGYLIDWYKNKQTEFNGKKVVFGVDMGGGVKRFGFVRNEKGELELVGDSYGSSINAKNLQRDIEGHYTMRRAEKQLKKQGYKVQIGKRKREKIQLVATKMVY